MARILLTAPYVGEVGWELMSWQGRVRRIFCDGGYDRIVVLGAPGKAGFYDDMPLDYRGLDLGCVPGAAYEDRRIIAASGEMVPPERIRQCVEAAVRSAEAELRDEGHDVETLWPGYDGTLWPCDSRHQEFIRFRGPVVDLPDAPWVVLVERTRSFRGDQNWPQANWRELETILRNRGVHTTVYPCESHAAIAMLSGCDLAVGQTTGGMHLAALCGCPTLAWSTYSILLWRWEITNRQRFETWWNPLGSPVRFHDLERLPTPEAAAGQVMVALRTIGRRTGSPIHRAAFRCRYAVRAALARRVIEPRRYAGWPWPLQKLVRYQLA